MAHLEAESDTLRVKISQLETELAESSAVDGKPVIANSALSPVSLLLVSELQETIERLQRDLEREKDETARAKFYLVEKEVCCCFNPSFDRPSSSS